MPISQEILVPASPQAVYDALMSEAKFAEVTGAPARIAPEEGGAFSCFGDQITGRHIELKANERIVQAWRAANWPEGAYSIVRFELTPSGTSTRLRMQHDAYPGDASEHLEAGWHRMYWEPLKASLA